MESPLVRFGIFVKLILLRSKRNMFNDLLEGRLRVERCGFSITGLEVGGRAPGRPSGYPECDQATENHSLTPRATFPFNKLMLSSSNVPTSRQACRSRSWPRTIARRTLLSSITVRPVLDDSGAETGMYTIPAGGRRFRALELLVKQKAHEQDCAGALHRAHRWARRGGQPGRERPARAAAPARSVPRLSRQCARRVAQRRRSPRPSSSRPAWSSSG